MVNQRKLQDSIEAEIFGHVVTGENASHPATQVAIKPVELSADEIDRRTLMRINAGRAYGIKLVSKRKLRGVKQRELCDVLMLSHSHVSDVELAKRPPFDAAKTIKICKALCNEPEELLSFTEDMLTLASVCRGYVEVPYCDNLQHVLRAMVETMVRRSDYGADDG